LPQRLAVAFDIEHLQRIHPIFLLLGRNMRLSVPIRNRAEPGVYRGLRSLYRCIFSVRTPILSHAAPI
jgi:hypothetical protein